MVTIDGVTVEANEPFLGGLRCNFFKSETIPDKFYLRVRHSNHMTLWYSIPTDSKEIIVKDDRADIVGIYAVSSTQYYSNRPHLTYKYASIIIGFYPKDYYYSKPAEFGEPVKYFQVATPKSRTYTEKLEDFVNAFSPEIGSSWGMDCDGVTWYTRNTPESYELNLTERGRRWHAQYDKVVQRMDEFREQVNNYTTRSEPYLEYGWHPYE